MKTSTFLKAALVTACINPPPLDTACILHSVQGQIVPPFGLEWDRWDAPDFRSSGIVYEWDGTALVGDEEASTTAVPSDNGHDWWNDLTLVRDEFGEPFGYAAVGYVGWSNWGAPQQGCFAQQGPNAGSLPVHLVNDSIQRGRFRSAIGMYDLDGNLLWIKAYHVGAFHGVIQDSNGDLVVCGTLEGNDQLAYFDDMAGVPPLLYNPAAGEPTVLLDSADCGAVSGGALPQMTLMKLDIEGDVLWNHSFSVPTSVDEGVKTRGNGYGLVETERDGIKGYRLVGSAAISLNSGWRPFMVQTDEDGMLQWKEHFTTGPNGLWTTTASGTQIMFNAIDRHEDPLDGSEYFAVTGLRFVPGAVSSFLFYYSESILDDEYLEPVWTRDVVADNALFLDHTTTLSHRSTDVTFHEVNGTTHIAWPIVANIVGNWYSGSHYAQGIVHLIDPADPDVIITNSSIGELHAYDLYMGITSLASGDLAIATSKWPEGRTIAGTKFGWSDLAASQSCLLAFDTSSTYWNPGSGNGPGGAYWFYGSQSYAAILSGSNLTILKEHQWIHGGGYETLPTGTDCRLGNPRMRQCNFNVVEAPDGGLVICGNTGHNFDDAYLAKLNFCYVIADFADLPLDGGVHLIEGPTPVVWDEDMDVRGSIVVDNDATLIIDGATIGFAPTTAQLVTNLKVLPGGRLELINGARLTTVSICEETTVWDGVIVLGDAMASQLPATAPVAQGYVEISGGSVIEHAITGIYVGDPNDLAAGGGVVRMSGTEADPPGTISNCRTGIYFRPYKYRPYPIALPGLVSNNQSVFQFAQFTTDDFTRFSNDFIAEGHHAHVVLDEVSRVFFSACHFENSKPYDKSNLLGHGIEAIDSRISVRAACPAPPSGCTAGQRVPTTFRGLDHGIHALEGAFPSSYSIVDSHFENNICGVYANQASYLNVSKNTFELGGREAELTGPVDQEFQGYHRGVFVTGSNALKIEDNDLWMTAEPNAEAEGIVVGYTYDANEVVRRNTATDVAKAFVGEGISANLNTPDQAGLQFLCNTNSENPVNFTSRKTNDPVPGQQEFHTIRTTQGSYLRPAGNVFDATSGYMDYDVKTTVLPIKYHHLSTGGQEPVYYSDGTVDGELQPLDVSPYLHTGCYPLYVSDDPASLMLLLDSIHVVRDSVRGVLNGLIDGGDGEGLLDEIALLGPSDSTALYNDALSLSPYLSVQVLRAIVDTDILSKDKLSDVLAANPEATRYQNFLGWLETGASVSVSPAVVEAVRASWEYPSPRWDIEMALGEMHAIASEVAHALLDHYHADSLEVDSDSLLWALERIPSSGAAYSRALSMAKNGDFSAATSVVSSAPLPDGDGFLLSIEERDMMFAMVETMEMLHGEARTVRDLDSVEVASTLEGLAIYQDRVWNRISNIFCFHYGHCRPPLTGGAEAAPKMLSHPEEEEQAPRTAANFRLYPNPTRDQVTIDYQLESLHAQTFVFLRDLAGRELGMRSMPGETGRLILDVGHLAPGLYVLNVRCDGRVVHVEKFLVQQ